MSTACSKEQRRREERNRKQREYRARIRAQETSEQREERNKRQRAVLGEMHKKRHLLMHQISQVLKNALCRSSDCYLFIINITYWPCLITSTAVQYLTYGTTTSAVLQPINEGYFSAPNMNSIDVNMTPCTSIQGVQESPFQTGNSEIFTGPTSVQNKKIKPHAMLRNGCVEMITTSDQGNKYVWISQWSHRLRWFRIQVKQ